MDTIWNCAFGVDIDLQNNPDNEYFKKCEQIFSEATHLTILHRFGSKFKQADFAALANG